LTAPAIPDLVEDVLTPEWMTAAFSAQYPDIEVTSVVAGDSFSRISTNAMFTIECAGGLPEDLPADLCIKGYFGEHTSYSFVGAVEGRFYRDIVTPAGVFTLPHVYADDGNSKGTNGVVITEDVRARGWTFVEYQMPYSPDLVAQSLSQLARLHAVSEMPAIDTSGAWLNGRLPGYTRRRGLKEISANFDGPVGANLPAEGRDAQRVVDAFVAYAQRPETSGTGGLIHGDAHVGNVFLDENGKPGLLDWQCVQRGHWATDIAYHIGTALDTPARESNERDLLRHYLDERGRFGAGIPSWDDAWADYRRAMIYGLFMWAISITEGVGLTSTRIGRMTAAAIAHDTFAMLGY
jgi:hypothetical protein